MTTRPAQARVAAVQVRCIEQQALAWIYDSDSEAVADLARRTLAQAVGLRRLLDQNAGRVSAYGKE